MGAPVTRLSMGALRNTKVPNTPKRKKPKSGDINTVYVLIQRLVSPTSIWEMPISAHWTPEDALIRQEYEEKNPQIAEASVTFRIQGFIVSKETKSNTGSHGRIIPFRLPPANAGEDMADMDKDSQVEPEEDSTDE